MPDNHQALIIASPNGLDWVGKDGADMAEYFTGLSIGVTLCENRCATVAEVNARLYDLADTGPGMKIIYYSGHGTQSRQDEGWVLWRSVMWDHMLQRALANFNYANQQVILLADCCHGDGVFEIGGNALRGVHRGTGESLTPRMMLAAELGLPDAEPSGETKMVIVEPNAATISLAACKKNQLSTESSSLRNGVFTHYFLRHARNVPDCTYRQLDAAIAISARGYGQDNVTRGRADNLGKPIFSAESPLVVFGDYWA